MPLGFELYKLEILCPNYGQPLELCRAVHGNLPHFAGMRARFFLPPQARTGFPSRGKPVVRQNAAPTRKKAGALPSIQQEARRLIYTAWFF